MSDIRKYIEVVEGFMSPYNQPRSFGRRHTQVPVVEPVGKQKEELERCRQFRTAEAYADHYNSMGAVYNNDPIHVRNRHNDEQEQLMARWNHWKHLGLI